MKMGSSARQDSPSESYKRLHPEGRLGLHARASGEENNVLVTLEELALAERPQGGPGRRTLGARIQTDLAGHLNLAGPHLVVTHGERRSAALPHRLQDQVVTDRRGDAQARGDGRRTLPPLGALGTLFERRDQWRTARSLDHDHLRPLRSAP